MTLKGVPESEIARAVKHSMVIVDAAKHKLDYRQSEKDNGIAELRKRYQGHTDEDGKERGGASSCPVGSRLLMYLSVKAAVLLTLPPVK